MDNTPGIQTKTAPVNASENDCRPDPQQWVDRYADYLYTYAFTRTNDEHKAQDLVQETFLAALEKIEGFESRSTEKTWLTAILKNKVIDHYRKQSSGINKKTESLPVNKDDFFIAEFNNWKVEHWPKAFGLEDDYPLITKEFNQILQQCMKKLPVQWLAVFTMKHMDDENTETICSRLEVTSANFWVIIHRTKLNLRSCLQKNWI
jgi:RNA polymerase sigma-70 factor (TIGR02943 family)